MNPNKELIETPAVDEAFRVQDESSANWVVRRIVDARQYAEKVKAWADGELRRAQREEEFFLFRYGAQLQDWLRTEMASRHSNRKSLCSPPAPSDSACVLVTPKLRMSRSCWLGVEMLSH